METPTTFAAAAGISIPYASQLLSGARQPSQDMALRIWKRTKRKMGPIEGLTDDTVAELAARLPEQAEAA